MVSKEQRILIADDHEDIHAILAPVLEEQGYEVVHAHGGAEALKLLTGGEISLCLLDALLPDIQGIEICKEVRKTSSVPIIFISAKADEIDRIIGIELGADDYIAKPFNTREVVARVKAVLRRCGDKGQVSGRNELSVGGLTIDFNRSVVILNGEMLSFTPKEMEILYLLVSNPGHVYSRAELLSSIWGYTGEAETRTVDTHMKRIRDKLERPDFAWTIKTVYGKGYRFDLR